MEASLAKKLLVAGAALSLTFGLTACAQNDSPQTGGEVVAQSDVQERIPAEVNATDIHFIAMMTPHHAQAVEMSEIILETEGASEEARDLAQRIKDGQEEEIVIMRDWADQWNQQEAMEHHAPHVANGMLTPEQMTELKSLSGAEVDTLFLQLMHFHHAGAIAMTEDQIKNGGYKPLIDLAQQMLDVQTTEMKDIEDILRSRGEPVTP